MLMLMTNHSIVAKLLGIDEIESNLKLEDKLNQIKHLSQQNGRALYLACL
jgi:cation transport ATPase